MGTNHAERQFTELLGQHHGVLVQEHPHKKWKFPDGRVFVAPFSGSDWRGVKNALRDLKNFLGVKREPKKERPLERKIRQEVKRVVGQRPLAGPETAPRRDLFTELLAKVGRVSEPL